MKKNVLGKVRLAWTTALAVVSLVAGISASAQTTAPILCNISSGQSCLCSEDCVRLGGKVAGACNEAGMIANCDNPSPTGATKTNTGVTQDDFPSLPTPVGGMTLEAYIGRVIRFALGITGMIALVVMVYAGAMWMLAGGNSKRVDTAKRTMLWGALGLLAIFSSYAVVSALLKVFTK